MRLDRLERLLSKGDTTPVSTHSFELKNQINALTEKLENIDRKIRSRSPSVSSRRSYSSDGSTNSRRILCYYHKTYKSKAQKCRPGCQWKGVADTVKILDECVYHNRFHEQAKRCAVGCRNYKEKN